MLVKNYLLFVHQRKKMKKRNEVLQCRLFRSVEGCQREHPHAQGLAWLVLVLCKLPGKLKDNANFFFFFFFWGG